MQGASIQGGGQPGGFSPGQNQVTPQDHEKVSNTVCLQRHTSFGFLFSVTMWRSWVFRVHLEVMFTLTSFYDLVI